MCSPSVEVNMRIIEDGRWLSGTIVNGAALLCVEFLPAVIGASKPMSCRKVLSSLHCPVVPAVSLLAGVECVDGSATSNSVYTIGLSPSEFLMSINFQSVCEK